MTLTTSSLSLSLSLSFSFSFTEMWGLKFKRYSLNNIYTLNLQPPEQRAKDKRFIGANYWRNSFSFSLRLWQLNHLWPIKLKIYLNRNLPLCQFAPSMRRHTHTHTTKPMLTSLKVVWWRERKRERERERPVAFLGRLLVICCRKMRQLFLKERKKDYRVTSELVNENKKWWRGRDIFSLSVCGGEKWRVSTRVSFNDATAGMQVKEKEKKHSMRKNKCVSQLRLTLGERKRIRKRKLNELK